MKLLLILLLIGIHVAHAEFNLMKLLPDERGVRADKCPPEPGKDAPSGPVSCDGVWQRSDLMECFDRIVDLNCDGAIQPNEIDAVRQNHLKWWERALAWFSVSTERIFCSCDTNKDGKITRDEFRHNYMVCLEKEWMMCKLRRVCDREMPITNIVCPTTK